MAVHLDLTAVFVIKTHEQIDEGGFSRAGGAYDGDHHSQRPAHSDDAGQHLHQIGGKGRVDGVGVIGDTADDVSKSLTKRGEDRPCS